MQRHQPVLQGERRGEVAGKAGVLELGDEARRDIGADRNAAMPPWAMKAERRRVLAGELDEVRAASLALQATRSSLAVASLTPAMFGSFASSAIVSAVMSITERGGML